MNKNKHKQQKPNYKMNNYYVTFKLHRVKAKNTTTLYKRLRPIMNKLMADLHCDSGTHGLGSGTSSAPLVDEVLHLSKGKLELSVEYDKKKEMIIIKNMEQPGLRLGDVEKRNNERWSDNEWKKI